MKHWLGPFAIAGLLTISVAGHAERPRAEMLRKAYIKGLSVTPKYAGGARQLTFELAVENPNTVPVAGTMSFFGWWPAPAWPALSVPSAYSSEYGYPSNATFKPGANTLTFTPNEIVPVCGLAPIRVALTGDGPNQGAGVDTTWKATTLRMSGCAYSGTYQNNWNNIEPDRVQAQQQGVVYVNALTLTSPPDCANTNWMTVTAQLVNATGKTGSIEVTMYDVDGKRPIAMQFFRLDAGQAIFAVLYASRPSGLGTMNLTLTAAGWNGLNPLPVVNPGVSMTLSGTCNASLDALH